MSGGTKDLEARLDDRLRYESAVARCCATLLRQAGLKTPELLLAEALEPLRDAAGAGRAYLFEFVDGDGGRKAKRLVELLGQGTPSAGPSGAELDLGTEVPAWLERLDAAESVQCVASSASSDEARLLAAASAQSLLLLPIWVAGSCWGFLGFEDVMTEREWTDADVRLLQTAAEVVGAYVERGISQEYLQKAHAQLLQTEKMATIGALVAGVAHEINTPLGAISSMHDTLLKGIDKLRAHVDPEAPVAGKALGIIDDANRVIRSATLRVLEIVRRLRDFARYDEGELESVDLHAELNDTLSLIHHELKHGVEVRRQFEPVSPIEGYANQLNQVFLNIIVNAKQAMGGKGLLVIRTEPTEEGVRIRFQDTGPGIDPARIEQIFETGFTTKKKGIGLGLGLAISQQIVERHHGRIWAENASEGGAVFVVDLPATQPESSEPQPPVVETSDTSSK